jgi:hypothetical protein
MWTKVSGHSTYQELATKSDNKIRVGDDFARMPGVTVPIRTAGLRSQITFDERAGEKVVCPTARNIPQFLIGPVSCFLR